MLAEHYAQQLAANWRLTPATLAAYLSGGEWKPAKHLSFISTCIATAIQKGNGRLLIEAPPRHGKTEFLSTWLPVWVLEHYPKRRIMLTTYGADLATEQSRKVRDRISNNSGGSSGSGKLNVSLKKDVKRADQFQTIQGGGMIGVGIGGAITGKGADILLVDDYVKNEEEAASEATLNAIWDWFRATAFTRLEPKGTAILLATRWAPNDLIGKIKQEMPHQYITDIKQLQSLPKDTWGVIRFRAICTDTDEDPLRREPGEALWPERYDIDALQNIRKTIGSFYFEALYQQNPQSLSEISIPIDQIQVKSSLEIPKRSLMRLVRAWDFAASRGEGDYTVGALCGVVPGEDTLYILDIFRKQLSPGEVRTAVFQVSRSDGPQVSVIIPKDPGAAGAQVVDHFKNTILKDRFVIAASTSKSKNIRHMPLIASIEAGKVILQQANWNNTFFAELQGNGHDDQLDAVSDAHHELIDQVRGNAVWGRSNVTQQTDSGSNIVWGRRYS